LKAWPIKVGYCQTFDLEFFEELSFERFAQISFFIEKFSFYAIIIYALVFLFHNPVASFLNLQLISKTIYG